MSDAEPEAIDNDQTGPAVRAGDGQQPLGSQWWAPAWDGEPGRLEVWYATATDERTGAGLWVHGETIARTNGDSAASGGSGRSADGPPVISHGWIALFPSDSAPVWQRTETHDGATTADSSDPSPGFRAPDLKLDATGTSGTAGELSWDLSWDTADQRGLATFPLWAWNRKLLPAAQVVPAPSLRARGTVTNDGTEYSFDGHGQVARIYGHGNAERWGWLHADLGDGDVLELVTAQSRRKGLSLLKPITFLRMRLDGLDWPSTRIASWGLRTDLGLPQWSVKGRTQGVEVSIEVTQPNDRNVTVDYTDPDGATATCTNTEQADVTVKLRTQGGTERTWHLDGTAHAEIGRRP